jgi:phytoene dehydrogenase-like protein
VVLEGGEIFRAKAVISNADPRTSFLKLLGAAHLDTGFVRAVSRLRDKGNVAKLHLALSGVPHFKQLDAAAPRGRLLIAPSLDHVERAFNPIKYGEFAPAPVLEITLPSLMDPDLAPPGQHVMSVIVPFAPFEPTPGWEAARAPFLETVLSTLEAYAPGLRSLIVGQELLTPLDIAQEFNSTGGHWHQAELAFDQFYMVRPVPGAAQYGTPMPGFYLCGAGAHPGGGVMGLAGRNAARQILREAP